MTHTPATIGSLPVSAGMQILQSIATPLNLDPRWAHHRYTLFTIMNSTGMGKPGREEQTGKTK